MVEILVVVTIIAILAGLVLGGITKGTENKDRVDTKATVMTLTIALEKYKRDNGDYPWSTVNYVDLDSTQKSIIDELLKYDKFETESDGSVHDKWGKPIRYVHYKKYTANNASFFSDVPGAFINPNSFQLRSAGPDEKWGTLDDVTNCDVFLNR